MAFVSYTAKRSLVPGRVSGATVTLILPGIQKLEPPARTTKVVRNVSLSLKPVTLYYGGKTTWRVTLEPVRGDEAGQLREFVDSIEDGQSFTFDPYGTPDAPSSWSMSCVHDEAPPGREPGLMRGEGGASDYVRYTLSLREY